MALLRAARIFDLVVVILTFFIAFAIAASAFTWSSLTEVLALRIALLNVFVFAGYLALCAVVFSICGFYRSHRLSHWSRHITEVICAISILTAILLLLRVPLIFSFATNKFLFLFWLLSAAALMLSHMLAQRLLYFARSRGRNLRDIIIVGEGQEAIDLAERIGKDRTLGYRVLRIMDAKEIVNDERVADHYGT